MPPARKQAVANKNSNMAAQMATPNEALIVVGDEPAVVDGIADCIPGFQGRTPRSIWNWSRGNLRDRPRLWSDQ